MGVFIEVVQRLQAAVEAKEEETGNDFEVMEKMGYGGIEEQKKQHRMFVQKLEEFTDRVSKLSLGTQDAMIQDLFEYLQQWLQDHIKVEDMKYARFAMEKTKGDC